MPRRRIPAPTPTRLRRAAAALLTLLLLTVRAADAFGVHRCPHHDALPAPTGAATAHAHGSAGHGAAPHHGACTCVGACTLDCCDTVAARPGGLLRIAPAEPAAELAAAATDSLAPGVLELLPFANGPPPTR